MIFTVFEHIFSFIWTHVPHFYTDQEIIRYPAVLTKNNIQFSDVLNSQFFKPKKLSKTRLTRSSGRQRAIRAALKHSDIISLVSTTTSSTILTFIRKPIWVIATALGWTFLTTAVTQNLHTLSWRIEATLTRVVFMSPDIKVFSQIFG